MRRLSRPRRITIWASATLAFGGWGAAGLSWLALGSAAGGDSGFVMGIAVAIAFTIVAAQSIVMPDQARIFALGVERGLAMRAEQGRSERHLSAVR